MKELENEFEKLLVATENVALIEAYIDLKKELVASLNVGAEYKAKYEKCIKPIQH